MIEPKWLQEEDVRLFLKESKLAGYAVHPPEEPSQGCLIEKGLGDRSWFAFRRAGKGSWSVWGLRMDSLSHGVVIRESLRTTDELLSYLEKLMQEWS